MKNEIENIKEATRKIHEDYLEKTEPTDSDTNAYKIALNINKGLLNTKITAYIKEEEKARQNYKKTQNQPLYMLPNDTEKRLKTIRQKLLNKQANNNKEFKSISTPSIMNNARKQSIENQIQQKLQKQYHLTQTIYIDNITKNLGLSQNSNKNASLKANTLNQVPNILSKSEEQAQALNARLNALEKKYLNYNNTITAISMPEENEYFPLKNVSIKEVNQDLYALPPDNLPDTRLSPNSNSSTLLKKNSNEVLQELQELQTNINTKRKARIIELQEKFKQTPLPSKNNTNN